MPAVAPQLVEPIAFKGWELNPRERVLLVQGKPAVIGSRAFDLLLALVARDGGVVSKEELLEAVWPGLVVEENNIAVQVNALRKALGAEVIATIPGFGYRLAAAALKSTNAPAPPAQITRPRTMPLPVPSRLLGRDDEVEALVGRLGTMPLVCLSGTGGVGKTVLAKAVVALRSLHHGDEVHWVDLAPIHERSRLEEAIASVFGIELRDTGEPCAALVTALGRTSALVVLDNCEHLIEPVAALVARLLESAPGIRWLVTSQEPLRLRGECVYHVDPLAVPSPGLQLDDALGNGALAMFVDRATAADRHFRLDANNLADAIELCRRLDGLPLAIEIAAARVRTLGLKGVLAQLAEALSTWSGPRDGPVRHHSLRSTFDWSHQLLAEAEQTLFRRLAPFVGGFTASMVRQLAVTPSLPEGQSEVSAIDALSALVDKSLVHRDSERPDRFFLYQCVRTYAERLTAAGESAALRRSHASVVTDAVASAWDDFMCLRDQEWGERYVPERHNVRAALEWAIAACEPDMVARLVVAQSLIDAFVESGAEVVRCSVPIDVLELAAVPLRARAFAQLSWAHYTDGHRETGTAFAHRALDDFRAIGDGSGEYLALARLTRLYESRPSTREEAKRTWEVLRAIDARPLSLRAQLTCQVTVGLQYADDQSVERRLELEELSRRSGFDSLAAICRLSVTDILLIERRYEDVVAIAKEYIRAGESRPRVLGLMLHNLALALVQLARVEEARGAASSALRVLPSSAYMVAGTFALAAVRAGQLHEAAMLMGFDERVRADRDEGADPAEAEAIAQIEAELSDRLAPGRRTELMRIGAGLPTADMLALALTP